MSRSPVPYTRGIMPVLPVPTRSEILHFVQNDNGEVQNRRFPRRTGQYPPLLTCSPILDSYFGHCLEYHSFIHRERV